jgi:hypothetical protein
MVRLMIYSARFMLTIESKGFKSQILKASFIPEHGCVITDTNTEIFAAISIYTMCFDFIVLSIIASKLVFDPKVRCRLMTRVFSDGLVYFIIA